MKFLSAVALLFLVLLLRAASAVAADLPGPSFDCAKASSPAETMICQNESLQVRDWWLDLVYRDALALDPGHAATLKAEQRHWLKERDALCGLPAAELAAKGSFCLYRQYDQRIKALTSASLAPIWRDAARDPQGALKKLQPLQGPLAQVYADLLTHALAKDESIKDFTDFTDDLAERLLDNISFWSAAAAPIPQIPCDLVERYPRLLLVSRSTFGNTMDGALPGFDCFPPTDPAGLTVFLNKDPSSYRAAFNRCNDKDGTIFASLDHQLWLLQIRLEYFPRSYLSRDLGPTNAPDKSWPTVEAIGQDYWLKGPNYEDARRRLAAYYVERFKLTPTDAVTAAARALWDNRRPDSDSSSNFRCPELF